MEESQTWHPPRSCSMSAMSSTAGTFAPYMKNLFRTGPGWTGRPHAETTAELTAQFPAETELIAAYVPRWLETITGPIPGMLDLVAELDDRQVPIYGITNFSAEFWAMFRPHAPVFDRFRDVVVSGAERLHKPEPEIYRLALRRFNLAPGEGLFIDDRIENIRAGKAEGFPGHHFTGIAALRTRLVAEGLL